MPKSPKREGRALKVKKQYVETFSTESGTAVLLDLMNVTGIMGPSLDLNNPNPQVTAFNEGSKSIFYRILQMVEENPESYLKKIQDRIGEDENEFIS